MSVNRTQETWAIEVVQRVLAVSVEEYDVEGRQNAIDGVVHYPDGRTAALEISSIGPQDEARISSILDQPARNRRTVPGLTKTWLVWLARDFHPRDLPAVDDLLRRCEEHGCDDLDQLYGHDLITDGVSTVEQWLPAVSAEAVPTPPGRQPCVWTHLEAIGGFTGNGHQLLPAELTAVLATDTMLSKISKLAQHGLEEQHLFLTVRQSAFSYSVYDTLAIGHALPSAVPSLPGGLTQVWLATGWLPGGIVRAIRDQGWVRDHPFGAPPQEPQVADPTAS